MTVVGQVERLDCSLLLELPKDLERQFWRDDTTLRLYTNWDIYVAINQSLGIIVMLRTWWEALADMSVLKHSWNIHSNVLLWCVLNIITLTLIFRHNQWYKQHRHRLAAGQHILRVVAALVSACKINPMLQARLGQAVYSSSRPGPPVLSVPRIALSNATKPLFVAAVVTQGYGSWVLATKWWLPLQLLVYFLDVLGSERFQPCQMAGEANSALLLQPTCQAVSDWHSYIAASFLGPMWLGLFGDRTLTNPAACSSMVLAATTLAWYVQAVAGVLVPAAGFCALEWRLKAEWVCQKLGMQLGYGPLGWPRSQHQPRTVASAVQSVTSWVMVVAAGFGLAWVALTWLTPLLPQMACETCADSGTCQPVICEGPLCSSSGHWVAAVIYMLLLLGLLCHLISTGITSGLRTNFC